ncbi:hypothetical protein BH11PSE13_BH11PSE13_06990 [soil metagenome]
MLPLKFANHHGVCMRGTVQSATPTTLRGRTTKLNGAALSQRLNAGRVGSCCLMKANENAEEWGRSDGK